MSKRIGNRTPAGYGGVTPTLPPQPDIKEKAVAQSTNSKPSRKHHPKNKQLSKRVYHYLSEHPHEVVTADIVAIAVDASDSMAVSSVLTRMSKGSYDTCDEEGNVLYEPFPHVERVALGKYRYEPTDVTPSQPKQTEPETPPGVTLKVPPLKPGSEGEFMLLKVLADLPNGAVLVQDEDTKIAYKLSEL